MSFYDHFNDDEISILRARAKRIANAQHQAEESEVLSTLNITIGGEIYALSMDLLDAVYSAPTVVPVPCTPSFIAGISNIRGQIIPVLDLAFLLGVATDNKNQALIVISNREMTVALFIEAIGEAGSIMSNRIQAVPVSKRSAYTNYLKGVTPEGIAVLDIEALLNDPALIVNDLSL